MTGGATSEAALPDGAPGPVAPSDARPIILYDGWCNLCDSSVAFILRRDRHARFRFAALQSPAGVGLSVGWESTPPEDTIIVVESGRCRTRSEAVLAIVTRLPAPWSWLRAARFVPRAWRDWAYDVVARHRRRWFGRPSICMTRLPGFEDRFLTDGS